MTAEEAYQEPEATRRFPMTTKIERNSLSSRNESSRNDRDVKCTYFVVSGVIY